MKEEQKKNRERYIKRNKDRKRKWTRERGRLLGRSGKQHRRNKKKRNMERNSMGSNKRNTRRQRRDFGIHMAASCTLSQTRS